MKTLIFIAIIFLSSCTKEEEVSDDVFVTVFNECSAEIKLFKISDGEQCLSDMYDCNYINFLPIDLPPGEYKLRAETLQGRVAETQFIKGSVAKSVDIEF